MKKSRFKFASNEMLIIGCGHDSLGPYENCTSTHEGFTTIDIRPEVKPDYIIDMTNPDPKISLGMRYEKIVFEGYSPSFWNIKVLYFLLNHLTPDGYIYLGGHPSACRVLTATSENVEDFIHKYTKIFDYNVLKERISTIENFSYKYQGKVTSTIDDCIETQNIEQFKYLIEYEYAEITRDEAYNIACSGNLELLKYIVEYTSIIATFCSPHDKTKNYYDFFTYIFCSKNSTEFKREALSIPILNDLCFKDLIFDPRSYLIEDDQIHDKSSQSGTIYYYDETADKLYQSFEELITIE
jgi:hypothetical protein